MNLLSLIFCFMFTVCTWCCSIPPGAQRYSPTQQAILAQVVIHGRVLNISTPIRLYFNVEYKACVRVLQVIKGPKSLPKEICFGTFGPEHLCKTDVYEGIGYIFFLDDDFQTRYDGYGNNAAVYANARTLDMANEGVCDPNVPQAKSTCALPRINQGGFRSYSRVQEGQSLVLSCTATSGTRPFIIKWSKRGSRVRPLSYNSNSLQLLSTTISDMGVYVCTIFNPAGQVSSIARVFIDPIPCGRFMALKPYQNITIKSLNFPQNYPGDKMCSWRICPSQGQRVGLDFKAFNLLLRDSIEIYHECDPSGGGKLKYCSNTSPGKIVSQCTSDCIQFWFNSLRKRNFEAKGFQAVVSSTDEGSTIFDFGRFYCKYPIIIRFLAKEVYTRSVKGTVLFNYKNTGPAKGKEITITMRYFNKVDIFGCSGEMKYNKEYYVGTSTRRSDDYTIDFFILTDSKRKPAMFDKYLNDYKNNPPACRPTGSPPRPYTPPPGRTDPPRPPGTPYFTPRRPFKRETPNSLDP